MVSIPLYTDFILCIWKLLFDLYSLLLSLIVKRLDLIVSMILLTFVYHLGLKKCSKIYTFDSMLVPTNNGNYGYKTEYTNYQLSNDYWYSYLYLFDGAMSGINLCLNSCC